MALEIREIPLDHILSDETAREPDRRLMQSLQRLGLCEPIHVLAREDGQYERIDGSRRIAAARQLEWQTIQALVETSDANASQPRDLRAIVVNTQRKNLRQLHVARHARRLIEQGHFTQADLARDLHLSASTLSYMLKVLECPHLVSAMADEGLDFGAAKALASLDASERAEALRDLARRKEAEGRFPAVRQIEQWVRERKGQAPLAPVELRPLAALIETLRSHGAAVDVRSVRATRTRLQVTLMVSEKDQEWVNRLLDAPMEATDGAPASQG